MLTARLATPRQRRGSLVNRLRRSCAVGLLLSAAALLMPGARARQPPGVPDPDGIAGGVDCLCATGHGGG